MPPKKVGPVKLKASPRDVSLPSPCDTFAESSVITRRRASTIHTKETDEFDEKMRYALERVSSCCYNPSAWILLTAILL